MLVIREQHCDASPTICVQCLFSEVRKSRAIMGWGAVWQQSLRARLLSTVPTCLGKEVEWNCLSLPFQLRPCWHWTQELGARAKNAEWVVTAQ